MRPGRQTRYALAHDLDSWKADGRIAARGFAHRWDSVVADGNGEDFFFQLLEEQLSPDLDVLDVGCGHGELTLWIARRARSVIGVERHEWNVELGRELLAESALTNVRFFRRNSPARPKLIPALVRYLDDLRRVARASTVVIGMHPAGTAPPPPWATSLPSLCDRFHSLPFDEVASWVTGPLAGHGIAGYRLWWIDVPEYLYTARSLYDRLTDYDRQQGDAVPPWDSVATEVQTAFHDNQSDGAVALRHIRLVWTVRLP